MDDRTHSDVVIAPVETPSRPVVAPVGVATRPARVSRRWAVLAAYGAGSAVLVAAFRFPGRPWVLLWTVVLLLIACVGNPARAARFTLDWLPILLILTGYDVVRSQASHLIPRAAVKPQLRFDEILFGGTAPTVSLQRGGFDPDRLRVWDYATFCFYLSHFVVSPVTAVVLYLRDRPQFRRYAALLLSVTLAGFATYFAVPAVPPWMASRLGALPHTYRVVQHVWAHLGLTGPAKVFDGDAKVANPVAALPSLHAAWPFMLLLLSWRRLPRGRWVVLAYNVAMMLVLVYGAEHYVSDIFLGWLYASIVFVVWTRVWRRDHASMSRPPRYAS